ncbi:MAG: hypothetical protein AAF581_04925 [Planctomycetota bacterium]
MRNPHLRRSIVCSLLLAAFSLLAPSTSLAKTFEVGEHGARIQLRGDWKREEHIAGLGPDQFRSKRARCIVIEQVTAYDYAEAAVHTYNAWVDGITSAAHIKTLSSGDPTLVRDSGPVVVSGNLTLKEGGLKVRYALAVVVQDGLQYLCYAYGLAAHEKEVEGALEEILSRFRFPRRSSEWIKGVQVKKADLRRDWGRVQVTYRPGLWGTIEDTSGFFAVEEDAEEAAFYGFELKNTSAQEHIEALEPYFQGQFDHYKEVARRPRNLGDVAATELIGVAEDGKRTSFSLVVPVHARCAEFRLNTMLPRKVAEPLWEQWLEGLSVEVFAEVTAFDAPASRADGTDLPQAAPAIDAWLSTAKWLGTAPAIGARGCDRDGADFIVYGKRGVQRVKPDGAVVDIHRNNDTTFVGGDVVVDAGEVHMRFGDSLYIYKDDSWKTSQPAGRYRARLQSSLLVVRRAAAAVRVGFTGLPPKGPEQLIAQPDGDATDAEEVARADSLSITTYIASSGSGDRVFIARRPLEIDRSWFWADPVPCVQRDAAGKEQPCGVWWLRHVGPAPTGWIVTGRPEGGINGVYLVTGKSDPELLISGPGFIGVDLVESRLTLLGAPAAPAKGASSGAAIYEVDLAVVREKGPQTMPFEVSTLNSIAAAAMAKAEVAELFSTRESVAAFAAACHKLAQEQHGRELPRTKRDVDAALTEWLRHGHAVTPSGFALLVALVSEALLAEGAEWVAGRAWPHGLPHRAFGLPGNNYVAMFSPAAMISSTLYDDDGFWKPIEEVLDKVEGRKFLLGLDATALRARLGDYSEAPLRALIADRDTAPLIAHLEAERKNIYLRYEVYMQLAAADRMEDLATVAAPFVVDSQSAPFFDLRASFSARLEAVSAANRDALAADLRAAIGRFSRAAALYLLLGEVYLGYDTGDDRRRAKQCFDKVLSISDSGVHADRARRGIERLSAASPSG